MKHLLVAAAAVSVLTGCGIAKDAESTLVEIRKSNDTQARLVELTTRLAQLTLELRNRTTSLEELTLQVRDLTSRIVTGINLTNEGIHAQTLAIAYQQMTSDEATQLLTPPILMIPPAVIFAAAATPTELVELAHARLTHVIAAGLAGSALENPTAADLRIKARMVSLNVAGLIATFAERPKFDALLAEQVDRQGLYQTDAYAMGALRYVFTREYLYNSVTSAPVASLDTLRRAVGYFQNMKSLAGTRYVAQMRVDFDNLKPTDADPTKFERLTFQVAPREIGALGLTGKQYFLRKLSAETKALPETVQLLEQLQ